MEVEERPFVRTPPQEGAERGPVMRFHFALTLQALWTSVCQAGMQHYPAAWGHYDVCKSQVYTDEGLTWDYMACQPEAADMTQYLKVTLDPPNITCGDPPETYCALVSTSTSEENPKIHPSKKIALLETKQNKKLPRQLSVYHVLTPQP